MLDNTGALVSIVTASTSTPAVSASSAEDYYLTDASDNVTRLISATGTADGLYSYDPYGGHMSATGTTAAANPYRFASAYLDPTGLYKMGARYYNHLYGRFTQQDSATHPGDLAQGDRYAYAGDDPINNTDPTGADVEQAAEALGSAFGIAGSAELASAGIEAGGIAAEAIAAGEITGALAVAAPIAAAGLFAVGVATGVAIVGFAVADLF